MRFNFPVIADECCCWHNTSSQSSQPHVFDMAVVGAAAAAAATTQSNASPVWEARADKHYEDINKSAIS
jgi:hypothetical protein